jgi:hypothetical protein
MLERAFKAGIPAKWVTGDSVYGNDWRMRSWLEERKQAYVLAVTSQYRIFTGERECRRVVTADSARSAAAVVVDSVGEDASGARSDRLVEVAANTSSHSQTLSPQVPPSTSFPSCAGSLS